MMEKFENNEECPNLSIGKEDINIIEELVIMCSPEEYCDEECVPQVFIETNGETSKVEVIGRTPNFLESCDDIVVFAGVNGSNGEDYLVGHDVVDDRGIEYGNFRNEILDLRIYE